MICGFLIVKAALLNSSDSKVFSTMIVYIIMPAQIIKAFQIDLTADILHGFLLALFSALVAHLLMLLMSALLRRPLALTPVERCSFIYTNAGNLVFPIVTALLGSEWIIFASAFICVQLVFLWTHGATVLSGERSFNWKKILLNVNIISLFIGLFLMLTGLKLPTVVQNAMSSLGDMIGPSSMLLIGMLLAGTDLKKVFLNKRVILVTALRLIAAPLVMLLFLKLTELASLHPLGDTILYVSMLAVMTPAATMITSLAQFYDCEPGYAGAINAVSTLLCIATMPLITALYYAF